MGLQGRRCEAERTCRSTDSSSAQRPKLSTYSLADDALHGAGERRRHSEAAVVQDVHCHLEAAAQLAQQTVGWNAHVVKVDLGRVGRLDSHLLLWRPAGREHSAAAWRRHPAQNSNESWMQAPTSSLLRNSSPQWTQRSCPSSRPSWDPSWGSWQKLWRPQPDLRCWERKADEVRGGHNKTAQCCSLVVNHANSLCIVHSIGAAASSPDPDLAAVEGEVLAAVGLNGDGLDGRSVGAARWFSEAEGCHVLTWTTRGHTDTQQLDEQCSWGCFRHHRYQKYHTQSLIWIH